MASIAHDLDVSDQTTYNWRRQDRIDRGEIEGLTTVEKAELAAANTKIGELETELAIATSALELLKDGTSPKGDRRSSK